VYLDQSDFLKVIEKTPLVSIDLIVRNQDGDILVGLRKNGPAKDTWFVPGGRIRKNETISNSFSHLTQKELGVKLNIGKANFLGVFEHFYTDNYASIPNFGTHYVVLGYEIKLSISGIELPTEQHTEYRWLSESQILHDQNVHENTKAYFRGRKFITSDQLLNFYSIYQTTISYYTNIIWAFPAAFLVLNFIAWDSLEKTPHLRFIISLLNPLFIQAFFKLVENQRAIVNALRKTEATIFERFSFSLDSSLIPKFQYNWFTQLKSADLFKLGLIFFSICQFSYYCYHLLVK